MSLRAVEARIAEVTAPGRIEFREETLVLEGLGGREVAAETLYTAISPGTEMAAWEGLRPLRPDRTFTKVVGYCNLARVVAVGDWVRRFRPGDLILTLESHRSHFVVPADEVLLALSRPDLEEGQLVAASTSYLFHQGYSALLRAGLAPGQYVAVIGLGTVGLATVAVARQFGSRVVALSDQPTSRDLAAEMGALVFSKWGPEGPPQAPAREGVGHGVESAEGGARPDEAVDRRGDPARGRGTGGRRGFSVAPEPTAEAAVIEAALERHMERIRAPILEATGNTGIDLVVTTCRSWRDWRLALEVARPGGRIAVLGFPGRWDPLPPFNPLDPGLFYRKQLTLMSAGYTPDVDLDPRDVRHTVRRNLDYLVDLVLDGSLPARRLVSAVEPWHRLESLYERIADREPGFYTAVLRWAGEGGPDG